MEIHKLYKMGDVMGVSLFFVRELGQMLCSSCLQATADSRACNAPA